MTTNCPEVLDDALLRAGRVDEKFKIDYATKVTAELTFKRIFGLDKRNKFKPETIDRFAKAFATQFPSRSTICTAELAKYCGMYRSRPEKAIEEFADWLKLGNDKFAYRREDLASSAAEGDFNVPEPFDPALLEVGPADLVESDTADTAAPLATIEALRSKWNPISWVCGSSADDFASIRDELVASAGESPVQATLFDGFCTSEEAIPAAAQATPTSSKGQAHAISVYVSQPGLTRSAFSTGRSLLDTQFLSVTHPDMDIDAWAESGCRPPAFVEDDSLTLASPRPIDDGVNLSLLPEDFLSSSSSQGSDSAIDVSQATTLSEDMEEFFDALECQLSYA